MFRTRDNFLEPRLFNRDPRPATRDTRHAPIRLSLTRLQTSQSQNRWIKLNYLRFLCKEISLSELNLLFFAHYFSRLSPCYYYILFFNDKRQTCLRDGKTLKVVLCTKFCPACDTQVIASALVQLRINFTCIFKVFQILWKLWKYSWN